MKEKKKFSKFLSDNWVAMVPYMMLLLIIIIMGILNPRTLNISYLANKCDSSFSLILVAVGQTFVLLTGGFDLSVGGVICITNCLAAVHMQDNLGSILLWAGICIFIGIGIGCFNGYIIEHTKLQPFIVTLATQSVCMGIALLILKVDGGNVPFKYVNVLLGRVGVLPVSGILLVCIIFIWLYFKRTKVCMNIYSIGSNKKSANLNGIPVLKTMVIAYAVSGGFAALSGLFRTAAVASGSPTAGGDFVMTSISAAVIGGTALTGGIGGIIGTIVGAFVLRYISDLLVFMQVSSYWSSLVQGVLLILAVALSAYGNVLRKRKVGIG
ncbi:ABC transporter permease [Mediterraneibacter sp. ICN-202921]|uniref:ABC transporter permease n=1 Tax=Mediterraneibacter sp. ICN-202921 TaxID=3134657 RepID=UPI0030C43EEC